MQLLFTDKDYIYGMYGYDESNLTSMANGTTQTDFKEYIVNDNVSGAETEGKYSLIVFLNLIWHIFA